jgi:mercuric ion transport protein
MDEHVKHRVVTSGRGTEWRLAGAVAVAVAVAASVCCLGPLALVTLGATGAWIGALAGLAPYRPLLIAATAGLLGAALFREYRKPKAEACAPGSACAVPAARRGMRAALWVVAALVVGLLALPYAAPTWLATATASATPPHPVSRVTLAVRNMTCEGCVATVTTALVAVPGVVSAEVTLQPPRAVVTFDPARVTPRQLAAATAPVGYPAGVAGDSEGGD